MAIQIPIWDSSISFSQKARNKIVLSIKELLENKHLYQTVRIDLGDLKSDISKVQGKIMHVELGNPDTQEDANRRIQQPFLSELYNIENQHWMFDYDTPLDVDKIVWLDKSIPNFDKIIRMPLLGINIVCNSCKGYPLPHNPGYGGQRRFFVSCNCSTNSIPHRSTSSTIIQTFFFPFQCQKCKTEPVIFMVRRNGLKLQIVGRNHFEEVETPGYLPKEEVRYYKNAVIAYNTGNPLAGILYLRTFIEQYMRRITDKECRINGEELCDIYAKRLPGNFPRERFKSLKAIYEDLSVPIHKGEENSEQFTVSQSDIVNHFDLLRIFPIEPKPQ